MDKALEGEEKTNLQIPNYLKSGGQVCMYVALVFSDSVESACLRWHEQPYLRSGINSFMTCSLTPSLAWPDNTWC